MRFCINCKNDAQYFFFFTVKDEKFAGQVLFFIPFPFLKCSLSLSEVAFPLHDCLKRQSCGPKNNQGIRNRSLGEIPSLGGNFAMNFNEFRTLFDVLATR